MGGVVVLPLRVSRKRSTSVDCKREADFGAHASTPLRWIANVSRLLTDPTTSVAKSPGTTPEALRRVAHRFGSVRQREARETSSLR
jgi:hypothetical protein